MSAGQPEARERSGHTAAADGQYLYVWGGYVSVADHEVFLPNDELWLYDLESGLWERRDMCGTVPPAMSGTCGCIVNEELFIFGGCCDDGQTNELYSVGLQDERLSWRRATLRSGSLPSPRDKLSCWVHEGRIIYFGGYGHKPLSAIHDPESFIVDEASWAEDIFWGWNNEVHEFDPERSSWTEPQTSGRAPLPRAAHASASIGSKGYVCGGRIKETRTSDVFCLDLNSWTWSEIVGLGLAPVGRSWHTLTAVSDSSLFLFGGLSVDCRPMSDGWTFNLETKGWTKMEHQNKDKPRLVKHAEMRWTEQDTQAVAHRVSRKRLGCYSVWRKSRLYSSSGQRPLQRRAGVPAAAAAADTIVPRLHRKPRQQLSAPDPLFTSKTENRCAEKDDFLQAQQERTERVKLWSDF
ncbi:kelch domain-containing protein 1-like [Sinocyclocheilus grahami]|uniref:kelch domain-containing protein 1-like n=1 Tax=Sinocyclocheilus grahami TaxID=75366 RepID=UPI0007AC55D0|nr:PREDICTED: kelch domain-containing protein 1-like [Sinocyclocheilus grahami]